MHSGKTDRRSRRTQQLIADACVGLMLEKRYDDITVQDILDRADIGRSTFYAHFTDKENLLLSQIERMIHDLGDYAAHRGELEYGRLPSLELFRHVKEQRRLMQALVWGQGADLLNRSLLQQISQLIETNLRSMIGEKTDTPIPLSVVGQFVANTFLMLLRWWFDEDMRHTPEEMNEMYQRLVLPALRDLIT
ncbi:MAG: TetR/AcrR family transcriptional regulator [Anaerolineae bacterium]|nr:TetR/AcrR family transcriptional regulator [Anaerolineae bacterium]